MSNLKHKINEILKRTICQGWDRNFLTSVQGKIENGERLSKRQREVLTGIVDKCSIEQEKKHIEWGAVYNAKYKASALILAVYHITERYYNDIAQSIMNNVVPPKRKFLRMFNNKYSQKVLLEYHKEPRLKLGEHVLPRASLNSYKNVETHHINDYQVSRDIVERFMKYGGFIVGIEKYILSAAKGSKRYKLIAPGKMHVFIVEERFLKRAT
jgi:hypothetical protein